MLIVPGFWRTRRWPTMRELAARAVRSGLSAVALDLRGQGDSRGRFTFGRSEWQDVVAVAEDLQRAGWREIDVIGFSLGGAAAVGALSRREDLPWRALLLISSVSDFALLRPRLNPFTAHRHLAFSQAFRPPRIDWRALLGSKPRAVDEIGRVKVPVTIIHVKNDWLVSHRHAEALLERAREPKRLMLLDIPGNWHADRILTQAPEAVEETLTGFFALK